MLFFWITMPVTFLLFAVILGGLLAVAEDWAFADGFWLVLSEVTNGPALGPVGAAPATFGGKVVSIIAGVSSSALLGIIIAIVSVPMLGFDLSFADSPVVRPLHLLNAEQREELEKPGMSSTVVKVVPRG